MGARDDLNTPKEAEKAKTNELDREDTEERARRIARQLASDADEVPSGTFKIPRI